MSKNTMDYTKKRHSERGFTLVEIAIVIIVVGMITSVALAAYTTYVKNDMEDRTENAIERSNSAVFLSQANLGFYPCPADPTLAPGDPGFGDPDCVGANILRKTGMRDVDNADGDNNIYTNGEANPVEIVLVGALPVGYFMDMNGNDIVEGFDNILAMGEPTASLEKAGYLQKHGLDGWGRKLTYAVSLNLTNHPNAPAFDPQGGVIEVVDEGNYVTGTLEELFDVSSLLEVPASAHYVIISHGPNGRGAYTKDGAYIGNCNPGIVVPGPPAPPFIMNTHDEIDNCDPTANSDARFLSGVESQNNANYNDDRLTFTINAQEELWEYSGITTIGGNTVFQIRNTNDGNVGFGISDPDEKVEVDGDFQAYEIHADKLCDSAGSGVGGIADGDDNCMLPDAIGGNLASMQCSTSGEVAYEIEDNGVECYDPWDSVTFDSCPPAPTPGNPFFIVAVYNDGSVDCELLSDIRAAAP